MRNTPDPLPSTTTASWQERLDGRVGACAVELAWWGHDFSDGAWPDTEDLALLLARTVRETGPIPSMRTAREALLRALDSVRAAHRWLSPRCAGSAPMACRHLHHAARHLRVARRRLADTAPRDRPSPPPAREHPAQDQPARDQPARDRPAHRPIGR
ncbi:hypothetical protein ACFCX4_27270 [Kitasatospora sp. NPDC056327]|uniref:hypothetical protein n=1 Tax=Kitasatospora sp. NPDC056327 TaxID=3345785 RepID=UPI0035D8C884